MYDFEYTIIGAGIIGLAIARKLALEKKNVLILEKNNSFGEENSSRNSGVIHAGIYYNHEILKSRLCVKGNKLLYQYAKERNIKHSNCTKLIISNSEAENSKLLTIKHNAELCGVRLKLLEKKIVKQIEPEVECNLALLSKTTGIIDVHDLMLNFIIDIERNKGLINYRSEVSKIQKKKNKIYFHLKGIENKGFTTKFLINCAGLNSTKVANLIVGINKRLIPKLRYVKGNYMKLSGKSPFNRLIYPIPNSDGLGIHSTINLSNETIFGPDNKEISKINFKVDTDIKQKFISSIKKYWPNIVRREIYSDYSGIRTKVTKNDFLIQLPSEHRINGIINLFGIESPGITSSIAISEYLTNLLKKENEY